MSFYAFSTLLLGALPPAMLFFLNRFDREGRRSPLNGRRDKKLPLHGSLWRRTAELIPSCPLTLNCSVSVAMAFFKHKRQADLMVNDFKVPPR